MRSKLCDVLLIGADWRTRALMLAELQEGGQSVVVAPSLRHAYRALLARQVHPRVILLDVSEDSDATPAYAEQLVDLAPGIPLILLTTAYNLQDWQPLRDHAVEVLRRPLTVGEVVKAVRRALSGAYSV